MTDTARLRELAGKASGSAWEARWAPGMPASSLDFGVISHETGKEVCRVWIRDDVEYLEAANPTAILSLLDELDASKARIGEVKPLVWEAQRIDKTFWIGVAPLSGEYRVKHIEDDWELVRGIINIGAYPTCDEAKAAAQADYTARILSALAPPPHGDAK
jgi:hypothetical protein